MATPTVLPAAPSHFSSQSPLNWAASVQTTQSSRIDTHMASAPLRRPKLSLNTTSCSTGTLGRGTALRLDALSAVSPTVRNTVRNGLHGITTENTPRSTTSSPNPAHSSLRLSFQDSPTSPRGKTHSSSLKHETSHHAVHSPSSPRIALTTTTIIPEVGQSYPVTYIQPADLRSILRNTPRLKRTLPARTPRTPLPSTTIPLSPIRKRVCFRIELVEEITNSTYTLKHSDIRSRTPSPELPEFQAGLDESEYTTLNGPSVQGESETIADNTASSRHTTYNEDELYTKKAQKAMNLDLKSPSRHIKVEADHISVLPTPIAGRAKKEREWVWTLGPINATRPAVDEHVEGVRVPVMCPEVQVRPCLMASSSTARSDDDLSTRVEDVGGTVG